MTTVGHGDLSPQAATGRVLAIVVMVLGIGFVAMRTAAAAEYFVRAGVTSGASDAVDLQARLDEMNDRLQRMEAAMGSGSDPRDDGRRAQPDSG